MKFQKNQKRDREAKLALGIGERFFLSIEANNQAGMDLVKKIAGEMDLEKLAAR